MESSPSLLEEDDALLHEVSKHGDSVHRARPSCSSPKDSSNKENINLNKSEAPKLSVEPLQMKRKKKGGGYNLRKSLAWDRAFFTEEGVLDPVELSMLSGTYANFGGEELSFISEEGIGLISGNCQSTNNSPNLQSHQRQKASHKVLTSHGGTGLKGGGCPRPLPSSSLKRPATLNAGRSVTNEFKFPRTAIPKPGPCSVPVTAKGTMPCGGSSKRNQIVQSVVKIQKSAESKIPTNVKHMPKVKAGTPAMLVKSSTKLSKASSPVKNPSSTNICSLVSKADKTCLKEIQKDVVPLGTSRSKEDGPTLVIASARQNTSTASSSVHREQIQARKPSGLRMPSPSLGFFGQPKPSVSNNLAPTSSRFITPGLFRDPRPSQAPGEKPKTLHDIMASLNSRLLSSRTGCSATSDFNAVSHKISKPALEENTKKSAIKFPNDSEHAEIISDEIAAHEFHEVNKKSEDHVKHDRHERIFLKKGSHHQTNVTRLLQQTEVCEHLMESDDIKNDIHGFRGSKDSNNSVLADSQLISQKMFAVEDLLGGDILCNSAVSNPDVLQSGVEDRDRKQNSVSTQSHKEISERSFYQSSSDQTDGGKFSTCEGHSVPDGDKPLLKTNHKNTSKLIEEVQFYGSMITGYMEAKASESCDSELENSHCLSQEKFTDSSTEAVTRDEMTKSTRVKERQSHASIGMLSDECCKNYLNSQAEAGDLSEQSERHLEAESMCLAVEQNLVVEELRCQNLSDRLHKESQNMEMDDGSCFSRRRMPDESQDFVLPNASSIVQDHSEGELKRSIFGGTLPQKADVYKCQSGSSSDVTQVLCSLEETCNDSNKFHTDSFVENRRSDFVCLEDAQSESVIIAPLPEACGLLTETRIKCDIELRKGAKSLEFSSDLRIGEDNEICVNTSCAKDRQSDFVCVEDAQSDPVIAAPLLEAFGLLTETQIKHDMQLGKEGKSSDYNSDSRPTEDNEIRVDNSCAEHCSLVGDIGMSTGENLSRSQKDFDGLKKNTLAYEDENKSLHEIDTSAGELHHELSNAPCSTADNNTIGPSKNSEKDLKKSNMRITLPRGVVPFSEEWLAAIEAAGEDILTLKTGAVQNSPPDKSLPEPSPWSPVRRKNNQIGPYDCTKFTNTAPSDSQ